jgi:hypothetical protein
VNPFSNRRAAADETDWDDAREAELTKTALRAIPKHELTLMFAVADAIERLRDPTTPGEAFERIILRGARDSDTIPDACSAPPLPVAMPRYDDPTPVLPRLHLEEEPVTLPRVFIAPLPRAPRWRSRRALAAALVATVFLGIVAVDSVNAGRVCRIALSYLERR